MVMNQIAARGDWRRRLAKDYAETSNRLASAYARLLPRLRTAAGEFANDIEKLDDLTRVDVTGLDSYQRLLLAARIELKDFAAIARSEIGGLQQGAITEGAAAALDMAKESAGRAGSVIAGIWNQPDPAALETLINYVDGAAMRDNFAKFGINAADNLADVILAGVAQGKNPRAVARIMSAWFEVPKAWAETTARTTQLWSYRSATHATYKANADVISGWMWWSAADNRTCVSCWSKHGQIFPNDAILNDHHNGRCTALPIVRGSRWAQSVATGPKRFDALPVTDQIEIMGPAMYEAYKDNKIDWNDLSRPYQNNVFGEMLRQSTLRELVGEKAARRYMMASKSR